jgi:hypothetical protein
MPERKLPHLFPEDAGQTICTTTTTTQDKQAGEYDQKQGQVGKYREGITKFAGLGLDRYTAAELRREPCRANLRMR